MLMNSKSSIPLTIWPQMRIGSTELSSDQCTSRTNASKCNPNVDDRETYWIHWDSTVQVAGHPDWLCNPLFVPKGPPGWPCLIGLDFVKFHRNCVIICMGNWIRTKLKRQTLLLAHTKHLRPCGMSMPRTTWDQTVSITASNLKICIYIQLSYGNKTESGDFFTESSDIFGTCAAVSDRFPAASFTPWLLQEVAQESKMPSHLASV